MTNITNIMMNTDQCDIAHETRLLNEFSEESEDTTDTQGSPQADVAQSGKAEVAARGRQFNVSAPPEPDEEDESIEILSFSVLPKCP